MIILSYQRNFRRYSMIEIYNEDYKKTIRRMKKNKIKLDAVITDPPYGVSRKHQLGYSNMGRSGMNYGEWDYNFDQKKWIRDID